MIVPSGGCTLICTQILTPHEHERLDLQITPFLRSGKIIQRTHPPPPRFGENLRKRANFQGGCIGFNPFGGFVKLTILAPNSWRVAASCLLQVCGGCLWCRITPRIAALGGAVCFFFWGGMTPWVCGVLVKHRHGREFLGVQEARMKESRTEDEKRGNVFEVR